MIRTGSDLTVLLRCSAATARPKAMRSKTKTMKMTSLDAIELARWIERSTS